MLGSFLAKMAFPAAKAVIGKSALVAAAFSVTGNFHTTSDLLPRIPLTEEQSIQGLLALGCHRHRANLLGRCQFAGCYSPDDYIVLTEALKHAIKYAATDSVAQIIKSQILSDEFLRLALDAARAELVTVTERLRSEVTGDDADDMKADDMKAVVMQFKETIEIISKEIEARKEAARKKAEDNVIRDIE